MMCSLLGKIPVPSEGCSRVNQYRGRAVPDFDYYMLL